MLSSKRIYKPQDTYGRYLRQQVEINQNGASGVIYLNEFGEFPDQYMYSGSSRARPIISKEEFNRGYPCVLLKDVFYRVEFRVKATLSGVSEDIELKVIDKPKVGAPTFKFLPDMLLEDLSDFYYERIKQTVMTRVQNATTQYDFFVQR